MSETTEFRVIMF